MSGEASVAGGRGERKELAIVVPAFNEAANLPRFVEAVTVACGPLDTDVAWRVLFVDDGSRDATWPVIRELCASRANVGGIRFARNFGKEAAIEAGLAAVRAADACIVLDADLQHPPELIPRMVELWRRDGVHVVSAVKIERPDETAARRLGSRLFYSAFHRAAGIDVANSSDFKLLSRTAVEAYLALPERSKFFRGLTRWLGFAEATLPFRVPERADGTGSRWSFMQLWRYGWSTMLSFSGVPLRLIRYVAAGMLLIGSALGAVSITQKLTGQAVEGFTTVILLLLIIGSAILFALGVIGDYLERIYVEVKGRPPYVVVDRVGR